MNETICTAIRSRKKLAFDYDGRHRVVVPYCHGTTKNGEVLRAIQVGGESRAGGFGFGKLYMVERMANARVLEESFSPDDPDYNPNDSAMLTIHCHV